MKRVCFIFFYLLHSGGLRFDRQIEQLRELLQGSLCHWNLFAVHPDNRVQINGNKRIRQVRVNPGSSLAQNQQHFFPVLADIVPLGIVDGFQHAAGYGIEIVLQRIPVAGRAPFPFPIPHVHADIHIQIKGSLQMEISIPIFYLNIRIGFNQSFQPKGVQ